MRLSDDLGARVEIDRVNIDFFNRLVLKGLMVYDQQGDTLLYSGRFRVVVQGLSQRNSTYRFSQIGMDSAVVNLVQIDPDGGTNLDFLTQRLKGQEDSPKEKPGTLTLTATEILLLNTRFAYKNPFLPADNPGVNFNDIGIDHLRGVFRDFELSGDSLRVDIEDFHFREHSGFKLDSMAAKAKLTPHRLEFSDLTLRTDHSKLLGDVILHHGDWTNYAHFVDSVEWEAKFVSSSLNFLDIGSFAPGLHQVDLPLSLSGQIRGAISDLKGRSMQVGSLGHTVLNGDIDMTGLPDFENTFIDLRIDLLSSEYDAILDINRRFSRNPTDEHALPKELQRAGSLKFQGSFTGFPGDFVAFGDLRTAAGELSLDLNLERDTASNRIEYRGGLQTHDFDVGYILDVDSLGEISAEMQMTAYSEGEFESATLEGSISKFWFSGYDYRNIDLDGTLSKQKFTGHLVSSDPNADFNFDGTIDFSRPLPFYDFDADIRNFNFSQLNLVNFTDEFSFSSTLSLRATGSEMGNFVGQLNAANTFLCYGDSVLYLDRLGLSMSGDSAGRRISFNSDVVDLTVTGVFDPAELPGAFANIAVDIFPATREEIPVSPNENFEFSINYQSSNTILGFLVPGLHISANTSAYGQIRSTDRVFDVFLRSDGIAFGNTALKDLTMHVEKVGDSARGNLYASRAEVGDFLFENPNLNMDAANDAVNIGLGWLNENGTTSGDLHASLDIFSADSMRLHVQPGRFGLADVAWTIDSLAIVDRDSTSFSIRNFAMSAGNQTLSLRGNIGPDPMDSLMIHVEGLRVTTLDSMGFSPGLDLMGKLDLTASMKDVYGDRTLAANGVLEGFEIEGRRLGDLRVESKYLTQGDSLALDATLLNEGVKLLDFQGHYAVRSEEPLSGKLLLDNFDLDAVNAFQIPEVSNFSGTADGEITVVGTFNKPRIEGYIDFEDARFTVDYLNADFRFSDRVRVENDFFGIDYKPIFDSGGNLGYVVASAFHENFKNWSYDISAEVSNYHALNTSREMNNLYYGQVFATGNFSISGYPGMLEVNIDAKTERGTDIKLPLGESEEVAMEDFVHFLSGESHDESEGHDISLEGVRMNLNVEATPDAQVQLIFDEAAGDILRGRGMGRLTLETTPSGEFNMFGRYEIVSGTYNFTMRSLINKQFTLRPGGVIGWYGDPYGADMELSAVYDLRTPLYPVLIENRDLYRNRELVNVVLKLGGKLFEPSIAFEIELPQAGNDERTQLASAVSTTNELNQQVFSLLILNRFSDVAAIDQGRAMASGARALYSANTSEFISNQLSGWLSEISREFDIGINYRPGDEISNQEFAVALSTQLFNERLAISGNIGVTSTTDAQLTQGQSGILGDFLLEYRLTEDGKIRLKVFNETNPYEVFSTSNSLYTQGVGLIYREEFDTLDEFFDKVKTLFSNQTGGSGASASP